MTSGEICFHTTRELNSRFIVCRAAGSQCLEPSEERQDAYFLDRCAIPPADHN
jgi:hypothetical protein